MSRFTVEEDMRHRPILAAALALAAAVVACSASHDDPAARRTACNYAGYCNEYVGPDLDVPSTDASCAAGGGTAMSACPTEGVLGVCTRVRDSTTIRAYHYDPSTVDLVRQSCIALGDTWTTP